MYPTIYWKGWPEVPGDDGGELVRIDQGPTQVSWPLSIAALRYEASLSVLSQPHIDIGARFCA
jgi:hypothetical protein